MKILMQNIKVDILSLLRKIYRIFSICENQEFPFNKWQQLNRILRISYQKAQVLRKQASIIFYSQVSITIQEGGEILFSYT